MPVNILASDSILTRCSKHIANTLEATGLFTHDGKVNVVRYATDNLSGYPAAVVLPYNMNGFRIAIQDDQKDWVFTVNIWQNIYTKGLEADKIAEVTQKAWDKLTDTIVASAEAIDASADLADDLGVLVIGTTVLQPFGQDTTGAGVKILAKLEIQVSQVVDRN